jgi:hypothetical protein
VLAAAGTAYAFDCIRVSSSLRGLQQSTKSGNWLLFNFGSPAGSRARSTTSMCSSSFAAARTCGVPIEEEEE